MARKLWTEAEIALLRWGFADSRTDDLARALGKCYGSVAKSRLTQANRLRDSQSSGDDGGPV